MPQAENKGLSHVKLASIIYYGLLGSLIAIPVVCVTITLALFPLLLVLTYGLSDTNPFTPLIQFAPLYQSYIGPVILVAAFITGLWMVVESIGAFKKAKKQSIRLWLLFSVLLYVASWLLFGFLLFRNMGLVADYSLVH